MKKKLIYLVIALILISCIFILFFFQNKRLQKIYDSVVYIESIGNDLKKYGSGFVYKSKHDRNYIITSYHVVNDSKYIEVYNTKKQKEVANLVAYNKKADIAILTIKNNLGLKNINIGNSKKVNIGDEVYVVGTPIDIKYISTMSTGIISFVNRDVIVKISNSNIKYKTLQISAPTEPGYSGGPVLDKKGNVIGMMFIKEENAEGISFALPIDYVMNVVDELDQKIKED